ncbi:hypothetical protein [Parasphingorhabdus sp.]|uniref:hypothetical protein n=1 Tax=Parasphingorhabdus sp. TaxID=2709688 RepID=UPI00359447F7
MKFAKIDSDYRGLASEALVADLGPVRGKNLLISLCSISKRSEVRETSLTYALIEKRLAILGYKT